MVRSPLRSTVLANLSAFWFSTSSGRPMVSVLSAEQWKGKLLTRHGNSNQNQAVTLDIALDDFVDKVDGTVVVGVVNKT